MFKILKRGRILSPEDLGEKDLLLAGRTVAGINESISPCRDYGEVEVIDLEGRYVVPGFIDQHVHLIGGGGEGGYSTRTPELMLSPIIRAGVTTVVGCLGTDGTTRHMTSLLAKARALEEEGITTYIYTGSYQIPTPTITGSIRDDLIVIDKVLGCGEIAISDHRSSQPTKEELRKIAAEVRVGGMLSGKAGVLHLHVGRSERKLEMLFEIIAEGEIPITQFTPTHLNSSQALLDEAIRFARAGGMIDFTTSTRPAGGGGKGMNAAEAVLYCLKNGASIDNITMSSDGNGSLPSFDEQGRLRSLRVADIGSLHEAMKEAVELGVVLSDAVRLVTRNPASSLKLVPAKGGLAAGSDADLVVLDDRLNIEYVFAKGRCLMSKGRLLAAGTFETGK